MSGLRPAEIRVRVSVRDVQVRVCSTAGGGKRHQRDTEQYDSQRSSRDPHRPPKNNDGQDKGKTDDGDSCNHRSPHTYTSHRQRLDQQIHPR